MVQQQRSLARTPGFLKIILGQSPRTICVYNAGPSEAHPLIGPGFHGQAGLETASHRLAPSQIIWSRLL